jgi:hypothetical protein
VHLVLPAADHGRVAASHAARDALTACIAAAIAARGHEALYELVYEPGDVAGGDGGPYRRA